MAAYADTPRSYSPSSRSPASLFHHTGPAPPVSDIAQFRESTKGIIVRSPYSKASSVQSKASWSPKTTSNVSSPSGQTTRVQSKATPVRRPPKAAPKVGSVGSPSIEAPVLSKATPARSSKAVPKKASVQSPSVEAVQLKATPAQPNPKGPSRVGSVGTGKTTRVQSKATPARRPPKAASKVGSVGSPSIKAPVLSKATAPSSKAVPKRASVQSPSIEAVQLKATAVQPKGASRGGFAGLSTKTAEVELKATPVRSPPKAAPEMGSVRSPNEAALAPSKATPTWSPKAVPKEGSVQSPTIVVVQLKPAPVQSAAVVPNLGSLRLPNIEVTSQDANLVRPNNTPNPNPNPNPNPEDVSLTLEKSLPAKSPWLVEPATIGVSHSAPAEATGIISPAPAKEQNTKDLGQAPSSVSNAESALEIAPMKFAPSEKVESHENASAKKTDSGVSAERLTQVWMSRKSTSQNLSVQQFHVLSSTGSTHTYTVVMQDDDSPLYGNDLPNFGTISVLPTNLSDFPDPSTKVTSTCTSSTPTGKESSHLPLVYGSSVDDASFAPSVYIQSPRTFEMCCWDFCGTGARITRRFSSRVPDVMPTRSASPIFERDLVSSDAVAPTQSIPESQIERLRAASPDVVPTSIAKGKHSDIHRHCCGYHYDKNVRWLAMQESHLNSKKTE